MTQYGYGEKLEAPPTFFRESFEWELPEALMSLFAGIGPVGGALGGADEGYMPVLGARDGAYPPFDFSALGQVGNPPEWVEMVDGSEEVEMDGAKDDGG